LFFTISVIFIGFIRWMIQEWSEFRWGKARRRLGLPWRDRTRPDSRRALSHGERHPRSWWDICQTSDPSKMNGCWDVQGDGIRTRQPVARHQGGDANCYIKTLKNGASGRGTPHRVLCYGHHTSTKNSPCGAEAQALKLGSHVDLHHEPPLRKRRAELITPGRRS